MIVNRKATTAAALPISRLTLWMLRLIFARVRSARLLLACAFGGLCLSPVAMAEEPGARLNSLLSRMDSFSARFEQMVLDNSGSRLQESQGVVELQRPGKFRWETLEPFPQLLVSDGETLWLYDQDLEQVTQKTLDERLSQTPALLLSGDLHTLREAFDIQGPEEGDSGIFDLQPRDPEAMFTRLRLYFESGVLQEMQLEDNLGQRTSLLFLNQALNAGFEAQRFQFTVPEGVDVITE